MNWEAGQPRGQGSPEGLLQADRRELELVAKQMLKHRMDSTVVVTLTGLSPDEVSVLKATMTY
ncbi:hypothetical protein [Paenibacillus daejeonensis]|uniref:hypothetical protein n=1 Tax=Paenibacillus daejeonensis TaxID=135193 RepID=UPI0012FBACD5|nr:hypothetical protein [Paenibacillus daejeonensis]